MKDIIQDPSAWLRAAAGTRSRFAVVVALHALLLIVGHLLNQAALFVVAGFVLPALYLYAIYRVVNADRRSASGG